jgi:predicted nucleic acid-binding protein
MVGEGNDGKVLAAALAVEPDYFVTGDEGFFADAVEKQTNVVTTHEILE